MPCVETDGLGRQCEQAGLHESDHFSKVGRWPSTRHSCSNEISENVWCHRDRGHKDECRPSGWLAQPVSIAAQTEYALWAASVITMFVIIGQLAAERAERQQDDKRFNWIEVD